MHTRALAVALATLSAFGCSPATTNGDGGGTPDGARVDVSGTDATGTDAAGTDVTGTDVTRSDSGGTDSGGTDSGVPATGSAGCGAPLAIETGRWVERSLDVGGTARPFFVWLPTGYDPARPYPVVYQFHGCSDSATREDNNPPTQNRSGADAIHIRGRAAARCWNTAATGSDVAYFDALVPAVESAYCADPARRFATGYSGGAFMTHQLACIRGAMLRGVASIAGGQSGRTCTGNVAALLIHDLNDNTVNISASVGARDNHAMRNSCNATAARTPTMPMPCEAYTGCDPRLPVVWCQTMGMDHSRQDALASNAFWTFLSALR